MKAALLFLAVAVVLLGGVGAGLAADMKDKVKVEIESVGQHPGMDPGMYVCALGHLHIKGTAQNESTVPLGHIKVAGKAFDADGKLLGTATATTKQLSLAPNQKAEFNLEFLSVTGPKVQQVKKHEESVLEAPAAN